MHNLGKWMLDMIINDLGWTLLHSIWQITVVGAFAGLVLHWSSYRSARWRYAFLQLCLMVIVVLLTGTFLGYSTQFFEWAPTIDQGMEEIVISSEGKGETQSAKVSSKRSMNFVQPYLPYIVTTWMLGSVFFIIRMLGGLGYLYFLRRKNTYHPTGFWRNWWQDKSGQMGGVRGAELLVSDRVVSPIVMGWWRPVVLVPAALWTGLEPKQLEAILLHELAHISRNDFFWNILLTMLESVLYYHPVIWWLSDKLRQERECCCDDSVLYMGGDPLAYAKALVALEDYQGSAPALALAALGSGGALSRRIQRILQSPTHNTTIMEKLITSVMVMASFSFYLWSHTLPSLAEAEMNQVEEKWMATDTFPTKGKSTLDWSYQGKSIRATVEDGKIRYLKIDGKEIPEGEFVDHEQKVKEMFAQAPPSPPIPPVPHKPRLPASLSISEAPTVPRLPEVIPPSTSKAPAVLLPDSLPEGGMEEALRQLELILQAHEAKVNVYAQAMQEKMALLEQQLQANYEKEERTIQKALEAMELTMASKMEPLNDPEQRRKLEGVLSLREEEVNRRLEEVVEKREAYLQNVEKNVQRIQKEMEKQMQEERKALEKKMKQKEQLLREKQKKATKADNPLK